MALGAAEGAYLANSRPTSVPYLYSGGSNYSNSFNDTEDYYYASGNDTTSSSSSFGGTSTHEDPYNHPAVLAVKIIAFALNILMTIIGNTIVITIILKNKHMRTTTYYYLMNLAIADIIIATFSEWTTLSNMLMPNHWPFGAFMCKFSTFVQGLSVHVSILTLMVVAGDRYIAILYPIKSRVVKRNAWLVIAAVWVISTAINVPLYHYMHFYKWEADGRTYCLEHWGALGEPAMELSQEIYTLCTFAFVYVVPLLVMSIAYIRIGLTLGSRSISGPGVSVKTTITAQDKARKKVVKMVVVVVITFALCWLPYQIYNLYTYWTGSLMNLDIFFVIMWLAYANSAMNPFIYCGFNENFRRGFRDAFTGRWCRRRQPHHKLTNVSGTTKSTATMMTQSEPADPTSLESML